MAVSVKIDQSGAPAGVAGRAREDLETGLAVTLAAQGGPFVQYQWSVRDRAVDILAGTRSTASLSAPTSATTSLSPIDVAGNYAGRLIVDSGSGLGASPDDVFDWTFYAGDPGDPQFGPPGALPDDLPRREPGFGERLEHNVPDAVDAGGNAEGWAREMKRWFAVARRLYRRQLFAVGVVSLPSGGPAALGRELGLAGVTRNSLGRVTVTFDVAFHDALYAAFALPLGATGGSACVVTRGTTSCVVERGDPGGSLADADFVLVCALRF
jgi:hypothetical protein